MDSPLLEVQLAGHQIFKDLQKCLSENPNGKLRNLLELKDDVLYVWNSVENCLLCLNLKHLEEHGDETPYQKLHFLTPPAFSVERIMTSTCGSRICVWGSRGVTIAELPSRWGRSGLFESGTQTILCKSYSLDERFLYCQGEIRRVHWHPSSLSHVLVLVSDNTIRLYNIALKAGPKLVKTFSTGLKPTGQISGRPLLDSLGDTAVDFTPVPDDNLLILRGNGDVYMMSCNLEQQNISCHGPLAMYPPADDNYGSESCSIVSLYEQDSAPPLVVVATCSAALYHCLLLSSPSSEESHALYVVEAVELNVENGQDGHSYPVHLYPCTKNTYACMHAGGLHTITLPIMSHLVDYALAEQNESECVLSALCQCSSSARHLVRCGAAPTGLALSAPPLPAALLLTADCTLLIRILEPYDIEKQLYKEMQLKNPALEQDDVDSLLKERQKLSFTAIIQEILSREVSQPILNISKKEQPSPKECLELVTEATVKLRGEYMSRQLRARDALTDKLATIAARAQQHNAWVQDIQGEIQEVKQQSDSLREKCALAEKFQDDLKYRCSSVIRSLRSQVGASAAERALLAELEQYAGKLNHQKEVLDLLKKHAQQKQHELKQWREDYKKKNIALGKSHSDTIASILQQQTTQISSLIEETKLLKDQLSIV